jgi:hypothetical protein
MVNERYKNKYIKGTLDTKEQNKSKALTEIKSLIKRHNEENSSEDND